MPKKISDLAEQLRKLRHQSNMTQQELAEKADVSFRCYQDLEYSYRQDPHISTVIKLARALNVTIDELLFAKKR